MSKMIGLMGILCTILISPAMALQVPTDAHVRLMKNPLAVRSNSTISELVLTDFDSLNFGPGDFPVSLNVDLISKYNSIEIVALIENFSARQGPTASAASLGLGDLDKFSDLDLLFDAYFSRYPHIEYAIGWFTAGAGSASINQVISAPSILLGREARCAETDTLVFSQSISGSPNLSDGVAGIDLVGVVTQNQLCLYADSSGPFGHTFVSLQATKQDASFYGFYPVTTWSAVSCDTGRIHDDANRGWDHRICWLITTDKYNQAATFVRNAQNSVPAYQLWGEFLGGSKGNCTSWAEAVASAAELSIPDAQNMFSIPDPSTFDSSLMSVLSDGVPFQGCGAVESGIAPTPPAPSRGQFPTDFDPDGLAFAVLENPSTIATQLGIAVVDKVLPSIILSIGGELTLELIEPPGQTVVNVIDWGDDSMESSSGNGSVSHNYSTSGSAQVVIGVLEDGSVQRFAFTVDFVSSGIPTASQSISIIDFDTAEKRMAPLSNPRALQLST